MIIGRTALFIPASSPGMIYSAAAFDADSYIFDLEDAVSHDEKDAARDLLSRALTGFKDKNIMIRINALSSPYWEEDLAMGIKSGAGAFVIPKATPKDVALVSDRIGQSNLDIAIVALIETTRSVEDITDIIKSSPRVCAILFGAEDYCTNLGVKRTKEGNEILYARARLANAAHAFGIEALDTPFTDIDDLEGLKKDAENAKAMGYTGKAAINPRQTSTINGVFGASQNEIEQAWRIINAMEKAKLAGKGVFQLDGEMIDAPIVERARKLIERSMRRGEKCC
jgi:citrate lyase subunit beta/citryl-CoA lyase